MKKFDPRSKQNSTQKPAPTRGSLAPKQELDILIEKAKQVIEKKPSKAAAVLTQWVSAAAKQKKSA